MYCKSYHGTQKNKSMVSNVISCFLYMYLEDTHILKYFICVEQKLILCIINIYLKAV